MKEAAGEANMTVVTIILITAIVAVVTPIITSMMKNTAVKTCCMNAGGTKPSGQTCPDATDQAAFTACLEESGVKTN
jgi:hypothetical protein